MQLPRFALWLEQMSQDNSYKQILRSTSIMGGAQAVNYLVGLLRVKAVAVLLGPVGVGLMGVYASVMAVIGSLTALGIASSGVRSVADAYGRADPKHAAKVVLVLRRLCWFTGLLGWVASVLLAGPISRWVAGSDAHAPEIAVLGCTLLFGAISAGQIALLQGLRRISDIARINVWGVVINTLVAISVYAWLGEDGIVPVMMTSALVTLILSYLFARRVEIDSVYLSWRETWHQAADLVGLGVAFMWSSLLTTGVDMFTRSLITREFGLDAAGIYQAAWSLSGMFAAFILQAMGADFYPRLTAVIGDHSAATQAVNEQTEIGILLALPGFLATLAFAPWIIEILYSKEFSSAADLLVWMVVGVFGRVISWPMSFVQLALGASRWFMATESVFVGLQALLMVVLIPRLGVAGAAYGIALLYVAYTIGMLALARMLIDFRWSTSVRRLILSSGALMALGLINQQIFSRDWQWLTGSIFFFCGVVISTRGLSHRLGSDHRLTKWLSRLPRGTWWTRT